jgi:cell division septation protein DedD
MNRIVPGVFFVVLVSVWAAPAALSAQAGLEEIERLTRLGRTEEAREALLSWWEDGRSDAGRRELQRALWLRGRLTVDPVQAGLDFRRLVVLYPSGQFTPDAILRLAQASFAMGDEQAARNYVATLVRDYPRSSARESAEAWLADAGPVPPPGDTPTGTVTETPARAERPRRDEPPPPRDVPSRAEDEPEAAAEASMNYYVQLGAFAEEERAVALAEEVTAQGVDVRVVRVEGSRFTHVRVGRFADRAAAVELLEELTARGISAALVRDDRPERPVGG